MSEKTSIKFQTSTVLWIIFVVIVIFLLLVFGFGWFGTKQIFNLKSGLLSTNSNIDMQDSNSQIINVVEFNDFVIVDYIGRLEDGEIFDTNIESVAREADIYQSGRDYSEGLPFTVGAGQMIRGFEIGVLGMKEGETNTITIAPKEAYGEQYFQIPMLFDENPELSKYKVGDVFEIQEGLEAKVVEKTDETIVLDIENPHPLAGKELIFDITLRSLNKQ